MRPRKPRHICFRPEVRFFKPRGIPLKQLEIVKLTDEELESLRLKNTKNLSQNKAAEEMKISQSTYQRILAGAYRKISDAVVNGKAIKIVDN